MPFVPAFTAHAGVCWKQSLGRPETNGRYLKKKQGDYSGSYIIDTGVAAFADLPDSGQGWV